MKYKGRHPRGLTAAQVTAIFLITLAAVLICITYATAHMTGDNPVSLAKACLVEEELT